MSAQAVVIDGNVNPLDEWSGTYMLTDPNELNIPDDWDIADVFGVSGSTYVSFRVDVYGSATLNAYGLGTCFYQVHMDLDLNMATGRPIDGIGAEYVLDYRKIGGIPSARLYDTRDGGWTYLSDQTGAQVSVTELRVIIADMEGAIPGEVMNVVFAINNGGSPPDDVTDMMGYVIPEPSMILGLLTGLLLLLGKIRTTEG